MFVIAKCVLHGGKKINGLYIHDCSFDAPRPGKIGKHLYADCHMPTPVIAWPVHLLVHGAMLL
ncbi:MAG: hypothetical protein DMG30_27380 [Acidobacteria bacterium]|nr:MAG: hypothetical protein DMG30_27380 [Acidobacteriota bacterium]